MRTKKLREKLRNAFGRVPDPYYFAGDMDHIRAYFDYRRDNGLDPYLIDETTWQDLDMDRLFKLINSKRCTSGEQVLYYILRRPAVDLKSYEHRKKGIDFAQKDPERRLKAEVILARLGCSRRADLSTAFVPAENGRGRLFFYLGCLLLLLLVIVWAAMNPDTGLRAVLISALINCYVHEFGKRRSQRDYDTVNYVVSMVFAVKRLQKLHNTELDALMRPAYESLARLRAILRTGGIASGMDSGGIEDAVLTVTLMDLITYEFLKNKLARCHEDVLTIHEYLGWLDASISIASYRAGLGSYSVPTLDFDSGCRGFLHATGLRHPLLADSIPNDCTADRPILVTGCNASGKSTYLKTIALSAIMAQSICTVLADSYEGSVFRIFSSMALKDDLLSGESYYIAETKSLKRILDAAKRDHRVLCVVDEVLRGTNTVERIAASSEVLLGMSDAGILCLAATHDTELCGLLRESFDLFHFEEGINGQEMLFDYRLREGGATSQNAIRLLELLGFDWHITENARKKAARYLETGKWENPGL